MTHRMLAGSLMLALNVALSACGDGDSNDGGRPRGQVTQAQVTQRHTSTDIDDKAQSLGLKAITGAAECGVITSHVSYVTRDPRGYEATASTALMVPTGTSANCIGPRPVLLYAHGTITSRQHDMAKPESDDDAALIEAFYAAHGYIVVAPNYLGLNDSSLGYHPYLNAEASAVDMVDGLRAALASLTETREGNPSRALFIAGYSQGGHVAAATHRAIERDHAGEFTVTAAVPMSGPYDMVQFGDIVASPAGPVNAGATLFLPYMINSYQQAYGDIYQSPSAIYRPPFDTTAPGMFPSDKTIPQLLAAGLLPADPTLRLLFGAGGLLTDSFRAGYPTSRFRAALQANTVLGWTPRAPMALCGGAADPMVYFANARGWQADLSARGITVPAWDLEDRASLPVGALADAAYAGFAKAKAAATNPAFSYHGQAVPPFCLSLARAFFAQSAR